MMSSPSILSLSAVGIYASVMLACILAAVTSSQTGQPQSHLRTWLFLAAFFVILGVVRFFALEEGLRDFLRDSLRESGSYRERRSFQAPLAAGIIVLTTSVSAWFLYAWKRNLRGRRNMMRAVGLCAALALLFLIALRLTSFHAVDALLYGPLKLNWVIDIGASVTVILAAIQYIRLVRARP